MKFSVQPSELLKALEASSKAIGKTTKPVCAGIKIEFDPLQSGHLRLTGSDGELFISVPCPATFEAEEVTTEYVLEPSTLSAALTACRELNAEIMINARGANLVCGKLKALIPCLDGEYPGTPGVRKDKDFILTFEAEKLGTAIERAATLATPKPGRFATNCVCLRADDTAMRVISCDAYGHGSYVEPLIPKHVTGEDTEQQDRFVSGLLIPYAKAPAVGAMLSAAQGDVTLSARGNRFTFEAAGFSITGLTVEGKYPAVQRAWELGKMEEAARILIDKKEWITAFRNLNSFRSELEGQTEKVRLEIKGSDASISAFGKGRCSIPVGFTAEAPTDTNLIVNAGQLVKEMGCFKANILRFRYGAEMDQPVSFENPEADKEGNLVEPQRVMSMPYQEK